MKSKLWLGDKAAVWVTAASIILCGCRAEMVEARKQALGPVPEVGMIDPGGGHVRYALKGGKFLVRKRRDNAFKKMGKHCRGISRVRIEKEHTQEDVETPYHVQDLDAETITEGSPHYKVELYRHIYFQCVP